MPDVFDELDALDRNPKRDVFDEVTEQDAPAPGPISPEDEEKLRQLAAMGMEDPLSADRSIGTPNLSVVGAGSTNPEPISRSGIARSKQDLSDTLVQGGIGLQEGFKGLGEAGWTGVQALSEPIFEAGPVSLTLGGVRPTAATRKVAEVSRDLAKESKVGSEELDALSRETGGSKIARSVGQAIPGLAIPLSVGPLGGVAAVGASGVQQGLGTLASAQDVFEQDPEARGDGFIPNPAFRSALAPAALDAAMTAAVTFVSGKLFGAGIEGATAPMRQAAIKSKVGDFAKEVVGESLEEGTQNFLSDYVTKRMSYDPSVTFEAAVNDAIDAAIVGGILSGATSTSRAAASAGQVDVTNPADRNLPPTFAEFNQRGEGITAPAPVVVPTAKDLVSMTPEEILEWKKRTQYGPQDPAKIAAQIDPAELPSIEAARDEARAQARDMLSKITDPNDAEALRAANTVSLKAQTLNEVAQELAALQQSGALSMVAKPEVAVMAPGTSGKLNDNGDPKGTSYHATPEDWQKWQDLSQSKDPFAAWGEKERLKNKYGGMPPVAPKATTAPTHAFLEVAPNPDDKEATAKWNSLPPQQRAAESRRIADKILPKMLETLGVRGKIIHDVGRFMGANNANIRMEFDLGTTYEQAKIATMEAGLIMRQQAVVVADENVTTGDGLVGFVKFIPAQGVTADQVESIFDKIGMDGSRTPDGGFAFGNFSHFTDTPISDQQMLENVMKALNDAGLEGEAFTSKFKSEYIDNLQESVNKAYGSQATSAETGGESVRQRPSGLNDLASEFEQEFNRAVTPAPDDQKGALSLKASEPRTAIDVLSGWPQGRLKPPQKSDFDLSADDRAEGATSYSKVFAVADYLSRRAAQIHGALRELTPKNAAIIAKAMAAEVAYAISKNSSAVGWYNKQMRDAMKALVQRHPDLDGDKGRQAIIRAMIAITSNGQDVQSNFARADELYKIWKETGKVQSDSKWGGVNKDAINDGLATLGKLIDVLGVENVPKFLSGKFSVKELRAAGLKISGELADHESFGSLIFGPKIGGGFYQNLSGNFDPVTMDRWFMRTFNRYRGTLTEASLAAIPKQIANLTSVLKRFHGAPELRQDAKRILSEIKNGTFDPYKEADQPGPLLSFARDTLAAYTKSGFKDRSEINKASQRLAGEFFGLNEAPANGSERAFIRSSVAEAQKLLKARGVNLTNADLQAVLWYLEKEIYGKLGATSKRAEPASYADAAKSIGRKQLGLFEESERAGDLPAGEPTAGAPSRLGEAGKPLSPRQTLEQVRKATKAGSLSMADPATSLQGDRWRVPEEVTKESIQETVSQLHEEFPNGLPSVVVANYNELPDSVHQMAYRQGGHPSMIHAAVIDGKIYIVANQMTSMDEVVKSWLHEQAGHFATDEILSARMSQFMGQVYQSFSGSPVMNEVRRNYPGANAIRMGREFVARLSEDPQSDPSTWNKLVAMVRQWLRNNGFVKTVSENDIRVLLSSAMARLASKDTLVAGNATIFAPSLKITAHHGTPHKIRDRFRLDKIGSGEGAQVYGWGLYFAERYQTAEAYRNALSEEPIYVVDGEEIKDLDPQDPMLIAMERIMLMGQEEAEKHAAAIAHRGVQSSEFWGTALEQMIKLRGRKIEQKAGNTYTVELGFDPEDTISYGENSDFLSERVYESLKKYSQENIKTSPNATEDQVAGYFPAAIIQEFLQSRSITAGMFYDQLSRYLGNDQKASEFLARLGVKGVRFLDQGSRNSDAKEKTFNYVVFDDGDITITQENGNNFTPSEAIENVQRTKGDGSLMMRRTPPPEVQPELGLNQPAPEPERADTKGKFFTGQYTMTDRQQQQAAADKFIEYKPNAEVISQLNTFAGGQSVPGLSQQNYSATIAAVMKRMFAKIAASTNPVDTADLWQLMDRAKSLAQQEGSVTAQSLEARKVFGEQLGFMAPVLAFRGLAQKAWARMLGLPEGETAEDAVSGITKQTADEASDEAQEEVEANQSELAAQRIINQLATSQSDTLKWPQRTINGVKETVKWFINGDITDAEFRSTMAMLEISAGVTNILHSVSIREREITDRWNEQKSDAAKAARQNNEEMRKLRAQAMIALKIGATAEGQVDAIINQFAKSQSDTPSADRPKQINGVKEAVRGFLNGDITEAEFNATLESIGIAGTKRMVLTNTVKREIQIRRQWQLEKERQRAGAITASILEHDQKLRAILNQIARENGVNWSELFLDNSRATQAERRAHLEQQIRQHPNLQNLTPEQQTKLALMLDRTWEQARMGVMRKEFSKRIPLPTVEDSGKVFEKVLPELIRQANLGSLDDAAFLNAFAKELGLPSLSGETATKLTKLAQDAQAAPEGVQQNKILQQMVDEIQRTVPAHPMDIIRDYWYNNVLSGARTLTTILTGSWIHGAVMAAQQALDAALLKRRPAVGGRILQAFLSDSLEGIANGWDVIKTGDYTRRAEFSDNINRLLSGKGRMDSLEGWMKHGNLWQRALGLTSYARRAVIGMDYVGAIGTRGSGVIYNAMLSSPEQLQLALNRFDKAKSEQARKQAQLELGPKAKPVDVRHRASEILEKDIEQQIRTNASVLGEVAAVNAVPVGFGGIAYRILESMPRAIQSATGSSKESAAFAAFIGKAAAGLAFARAAINMTQSASNWMPLVGGVNWARALAGKKLPEGHWARVMGVLDSEGKPLTDDRRRLIMASQIMGISLTAIAYALTRGGGAGDDEDKEKKRFDVSGSWYGITPQQRKDRMAAGERPLSIRVNGRWINYGNLPMAGALATIGNLRDRERSEGQRASADDVTGHIVDAWASGIFYIKDVSVLSSLSRALGVSAMNTDEGASALNRLVAQQASNLTGLIPFGSTVREIDTFFDPKTYKPTKGMDYWIRGIPFVRRGTGEGPDYNMAGLPVENMLTPQSRLVAAKAPRDPVVEALSSLIAKGKFPHHPDVSPSWVKNGEQKSAKDLPKETYQYQTEVLKQWREIMLTDIDFLKQASPEDYEDYYKKYLAPVRDSIKAEMQMKIDPTAIDAKGRVYPEYRKAK